MTRFRQLTSVLLAAAVMVGSGLPSPATATALEITNLRVKGGEDTWHPDRFFQVSWDQDPWPPIPPSAVAYRLYDSTGNPVAGLVTVPGPVHALDRVEVPPIPGIYTIGVWLLDANGEAGQRATATLRFDDVPPRPPRLEAPSRWLLGSEPAIVEIGAPPAPHPVSGIRGYAVSVDRGTPGSPCASLTRCKDEELDLWTESGKDSISLGVLPEGTTVARVAAVSAAGIPSGIETVSLRVDATPPELSLQGIPMEWSDEPVRVSAHARDALSGVAAAGVNGPFTAISVDGALPTLAWGNEASAWVTGSGIHAIDTYARDAAGNVAGEGVKAPSPSAVVRIDEDPPRVAFASAQDASEPERLEATVSDALSGPSPSRGSIALRRAGTNARYQQLPTEVVGGKLIAHWDSDAFPPGKYEFLATGFDVAGNLSTTTTRDRGARMILVNPMKAPVSLESGFVDKRRGWDSAKRVRLDQGIRFGGRLRRLGGAPVAGEAIAVTEIFGPGAETRQRRTTVRTGQEGAFSLRLDPGPSRDVVATYAGNRLLTLANGASAHLSTLTSVRLRASAAKAEVGGKPIVFSGKIGAAEAKRAVRGLPVELQFRYPGAGWREFRTIEADGRGRFRYAYRFSDDDSRGVRFRFRAYVKGREDWPYEPAASRPVTVKGR